MTSVQILAVDDDPNQLASLKRILRRSRFDVDTATSGKIGLRMALARRPDLILLDVSMPTMSGYEFVRRLRRLESRGSIRGSNINGLVPVLPIPVIFLTALAGQHQRISGLGAGVVDYITKPFDPDELRARLRNQLQQSRQQKQMMLTAESELRQLASSLDEMREAVRGCGRLLFDLNAELELAGLVHRPELRNDLLARARKDVGRLTRSLVSIAEMAAAKETVA